MRRVNLSAQLGVGIVEILVAVLVLSIGLLGLAGLQIHTLRNSTSSMERNVAVMETHAIADAMRADRNSATDGDFDLALGTLPADGESFAAVVLDSWIENLKESLGDDAWGGVNCNDSALCQIEIQWNDSRATGGDATHSVITEVQL